MTDAQLINIDDYARAAKTRLDKNAHGYYASGAHDEISLRDSHTAYDRIQIHYRVLVDVSERTASTTVLGQKISMPVMIAPTAFHKMAHEDGEVATARAAGDADTIMILSSLSNVPVEDVVKCSSGSIWFQLYVYKDRSATEALVRRAEASGCKALVVTVDAPRLGRRERDVRNRFHLPHGLHAANLLAEGYDEVEQQMNESGLAAYFESLIDPSLSWKDIAWLKSITKLPVLIKGIVRPDDARRAVDHGAAGIVVSNHGGRQLDTSPSTIEVLPSIVDAVDQNLEVFVDGGVRRGTDILKALAFGAKAVLIGRPILWGLAVAGPEGVARVLDIYREELDLAMALSGTPSIDAITPDLVVAAKSGD